MKLETLKSRAEFDRVRAGRKWAARGFLLQAMPREPEGGHAPPRFGFAVSSRALTEKGQGKPAKRAGAVQRNRAKRRLREALRLLVPMHAKPNYDYVLVGRREALHQRFADLLEDMQLAFGKVHRSPRPHDGKARLHKGRKASAGESQRETEGT